MGKSMAEVGPARALRVVRVGPLATVQDLGRPGRAQLGVTRSGAADRAALRRANRLVGNVEPAAGLEVLLGGLEVVAGAHLVIAVCGAGCPVRLDGRPAPRDAVLDLPPGARLELGTATTGLRAYLAVRGGLAVPAVLGSRARDTLADLGPPPVRAGDLLPVGPSGAVPGADVAGWPTVEVSPAAPAAGPAELVVLPAAPGPRLDWLAADAVRALWSARWTVSPDSDRVGVRLIGPVLDRTASRRDAELPSEGLTRGAVQVPPGGQPVLFLADHPVTGGYPVVAVVLDADVDRAAQLRPGQQVGFRPTRPAASSRRPVRPDLDNEWWGW
jgi:biotin-dependent carboxylase-like uncharacterized protein